MELIRGLYNLSSRHLGCVTTMGAFDGVHHGHRLVLEQLVEKGKELGLAVTVVVFEPLPREYFSPLRAPARLMSFREKFNTFGKLGIDRVLRIRFTDFFRSMSASDFIQNVFVEGLQARYIVVGDDLRFGRNRSGDFALLKAAGEQQNFEVVSTNTLIIRGDRVSSTRIRKALEDADFELAEALLGKPYSISGRVVAGKQLGRTLNAPTANIALHRLRAVLSGVYVVEANIGGRILPGVANIGTRPTVSNSDKAILEIHLFDFNEDIYGENVEVTFRKKIRDEKSFSSIEELKKQIQNDIEIGRKLLI